MIIIFVKLLTNPTMHDNVKGRTQISFTEAYGQVRTVILKFVLATQSLFSFDHLVTMSMCAKLVLNPRMQDRVHRRTRTGLIEAYAQSFSANCDLDL